MLHNSPEDEIDDILLKMPGQSTFTKGLVASVKLVLDKGGKTAVAEFGLKKFGISFNLKHPGAVKYLKEKERFQLSDYRGTIHDTTKQGIKKILVRAAANGQSYQVTAEQIVAQGEAGVFSTKRAQLIATREIGVAYEEGNALPIRDFRNRYPDRVVMKFWQTVEDDRVTEKHRKNQDDGWIPVEQKFSGTGDDKAPGSDNPRCRCFTKYNILPPE